MAVAAFLAPVGCSIGGDSEPKPVSGVPKEIAATVDQLERAMATGTTPTVCDRLFTAAARKRAGGADCAKQLTAAAEGVRRPAIEIRGIDVNGNTRRREGAPRPPRARRRLIDTLELRREGGRWLVEALS